MGLLSRLAGAFRPPVESRSSAFYAPTIAGWGPSISGATIDPILAENLSTTVAAIHAIASGLASLPACVYRHDATGRTEAPDHPVSALILRPNPYQTWPDLIELLMGQVLLWGNALAVIDHDSAGQPTALTPVPWQSVQVAMLPSGQLAYDIVSYSSPWGGTGTPRRFLAGDCLHLKDRGDNPYVGRSRISRAPGVITAAAGLSDYSAAVWQNAATPSGLVSLPGNISVDGKRRAESFFTDRHAGAANAGRVMFVDPETKWQSISCSPEDAEILASRLFSVQEVARLFGVPPQIIGELSHGSFRGGRVNSDRPISGKSA